MCDNSRLLRAVVLAGGRGIRLRPYTVALPKPLVPIGETPIVEIIIKQLGEQGFSHVTIAVNHQADLIRAFFGDGSRWGLRVDYSLETEPLGTIAPLTLIRDLPENFLVLNGDVLTDLQFGPFLSRHEAENRLFTISAARRTERTDYGVLHVSADNSLKRFEEKPEKHYLVSMGVYAMNRRVLSLIPPGQKYGFDNLMNDMLQASLSVQVQVHGGYWQDIGRPEDYARATQDFERDGDRFLTR